ncbi:MAG: M20/M25/M40 family metallo-hydrolase [Gemmatimonadales bacterium]|nr:MAG: M20/M25/M40 family metallo-hydrolase [Gemmatimonadales bacterium]
MPRSPDSPSLLRTLLLTLLTLGVLAPAPGEAQVWPEPDWTAVEEETLRHFQALLRLDTSNPPGNETLAAEYLREVLEAEGIPSRILALEPERGNLVARVGGNGSREPLLLMGHTDVVTVIPERWEFPPFDAVRHDGYIYGRGALDDKDNVVASLMMLLLLHRMEVPLDRDIIFLAEAGEEGTTRVGIDFMVQEHWGEIASEFCLAEGGGVVLRGGEPVLATIGTLEKIPRTVELIARGPSGHGSVPLPGNAIARLARAVAAMAEWDPEPRLNETTQEYFRRMAEMSAPEEAERFRAVSSGDPNALQEALAWFRENAPAYASQLQTSVSPTILEGGDRMNVIPSEARAVLDIRALPDEDPDQLLDLIRSVVDDPGVEVRFAPRDGMQRPAGGTSIDTDAFRAIEEAVTRHYGTVSLPTMSTGATDMAQVRSMGVDCYGIGPAVDAEDQGLGYGAHGDQERILEAELHRFVRFYWDVVLEIAGSRAGTR